MKKLWRPNTYTVTYHLIRNVLALADGLAMKLVKVVYNAGTHITRFTSKKDCKFKINNTSGRTLRYAYF